MENESRISEAAVAECLKSLGISLLGDWDVLVFLYRHQASLASAGQIARLLGYSVKVVADALDRLESRQLVRRSRSSLGVRFYQFVFSDAHLAPESCIQRLIHVSAFRSGRLVLVKHLRQGAVVQVAEGGRQSDRE